MFILQRLLCCIRFWCGRGCWQFQCASQPPASLQHSSEASANAHTHARRRRSKHRWRMRTGLPTLPLPLSLPLPLHLPLPLPLLQVNAPLPPTLTRAPHTRQRMAWTSCSPTSGQHGGRACCRGWAGAGARDQSMFILFSIEFPESSTINCHSVECDRFACSRKHIHVHTRTRTRSGRGTVARTARPRPSATSETCRDRRSARAPLLGQPGGCAWTWSGCFSLRICFLAQPWTSSASNC